MINDGTVAAENFVVDASVAIKWFVAEEQHEDARRLLLKSVVSFHVPDLFYAEFGNILWKKARRPGSETQVGTDQGRAILTLLLELPVTIYPVAPILPLAYDLAMGHEGQTVYDCCYLALAVTLGCRFVTADQSFYRAMKPGPNGPHLHWITDAL